jgi:hypothetical protein
MPKNQRAARSGSSSSRAALTPRGRQPWLAFGVFGVHLLFVDDKVAEAPPVFAGTESPTTGQRFVRFEEFETDNWCARFSSPCGEAALSAT